MRIRTAAEVAELISSGGEPCELVGASDVLIGPAVVIDSRAGGPGALFVALPGVKVDGHDFVAAAAEAGAAAALTSRQVATPIVQLVTTDAQRGLTALARSLHAEARRRGMLTVAITGSAGKTSTKDLLAQVLAAAGETVSPVGSFNNEIGTPLTVCKIDDTTEFLVSEMGARALGDVAHLCSVVKPSASIVLNVGTAHLGEFGSQQAIAQAKGEIVESLTNDGWAVLNADDPLVDAMAARTSAHIARFTVGTSRQPQADLVVRSHDLVADDLDRFGFTLSVTDPTGRTESSRVQLRVLGRHQVVDATAAATAALALGVPLETVADALNRAVPLSPWRMELHELASGAAVINDAYNANPDSMAAALRTLAAIADRRRVVFPGARAIAVLGDMLELGDTAPGLHRELGALAAELGIDEVIAVGEYAGELAVGASQAGGCGMVAPIESAAQSLELRRGDVVLIKASRGLRLELVSDQLVDGEVEQ